MAYSYDMDAIDIRPATRPLDATVTLPGSQSMTSRALIIAALADGTTTLDNICLADVDGSGTPAVVGANWSGEYQPVELWRRR